MPKPIWGTLVYLGSADANHLLTIAEISGSGIRRRPFLAVAGVEPHRVAHYVAWSHDRSQVLVSTEHTGFNQKSRQADGRILRVAIKDGAVTEVAKCWSHCQLTGEALDGTIWGTSYARVEPFLITPDGKLRHWAKTAPWPRDCDLVGFDLAPDGKNIAFALDARSEKCPPKLAGIYSMTASAAAKGPTLGKPQRCFRTADSPKPFLLYGVWFESSARVQLRVRDSAASGDGGLEDALWSCNVDGTAPVRDPKSTDWSVRRDYRDGRWDVVAFPPSGASEEPITLASDVWSAAFSPATGP